MTDAGPLCDDWQACPPREYAPLLLLYGRLIRLQRLGEFPCKPDRQIFLPPPDHPHHACIQAALIRIEQESLANGRESTEDR